MAQSPARRRWAEAQAVAATAAQLRARLARVEEGGWRKELRHERAVPGSVVFAVRDSCDDGRLLTLFTNYCQSRGYEVTGWNEQDGKVHVLHSRGSRSRNRLHKDVMVVASKGSRGAGVRHKVTMQLHKQRSDSGTCERRYLRLFGATRCPAAPCCASRRRACDLERDLFPGLQAALHAAGATVFSAVDALDHMSVAGTHFGGGGSRAVAAAAAAAAPAADGCSISTASPATADQCAGTGTASGREETASTE
jgi:hypothetical protein